MQFGFLWWQVWFILAWGLCYPHWDAGFCFVVILKFLMANKFLELIMFDLSVESCQQTSCILFYCLRRPEMSTLLYNLDLISCSPILWLPLTCVAVLPSYPIQVIPEWRPVGWLSNTKWHKLHSAAADFRYLRSSEIKESTFRDIKASIRVVPSAVFTKIACKY